MMNKIYILFSMIVVLLSCAEKSASVHLKGQLRDMGSQDVVMSYNGASSLVGDSRDILLHTDAEGRFDTILELTQPEFYSISRNTLYLTPGDDMEVFITNSNEDAVFKGIGAEANNYMKGRLFPKGGSFLGAGRNVKADFAGTKLVVDSLAALRRAELEALKQVSDEFRALEEARITADVVNSYICYGSYAKEFYKLPRTEIKAAVENHMKSIAPLLNRMYGELTAQELMNVAVVRDVLSYQEEDNYGWFEGIVLPERTLELYAADKETGVLREEVSQATVDRVNQFIAITKHADVAAELAHKVAQVSRLLPGQPAIDFVLNDKEGNATHLSDFKGKLIYVDLWATWCGPCIAESPAFEALAEQYKEQEIVFVPVSTDDQKSAWLNYLSGHDKKLSQYNSTDIALKDGWCVMYIPRFVLIDKDFNIINAYAPRPSTDEATSLLNSLLK